MAQVNLIAQILTQIFFFFIFLISFLDTEVQEQNTEVQNIYSDLYIILTIETSKMFISEKQG